MNANVPLPVLEELRSLSEDAAEHLHAYLTDYAPDPTPQQARMDDHVTHALADVEGIKRIVGAL